MQTNTNKAVWVTGASGMLGTDLCAYLAELHIPFYASNSAVDITDPQAIEDYSQGKKIAWVVNCAAYTAVDKAEDEREAAFAINEKGPKNLSLWCAANKVRLIHISTDYVFDGAASIPYVETTPTNPQSVYGKSKEAGETAIQSNLSEHFILRTAWLYGINGPNFVKTMLRLFRERDSLGVVADQYGTPTWTRNVTEAIGYIIQSDSHEFGVYHASCEGMCTWHDFAETIATFALREGILLKKPDIRSLKTSEYPTKAQRPLWSVLSKDKLKHTFKFEFSEWQESIKTFLNSYKSEL